MTSTPSSRDWKEEYEACRVWDRPPRNDLTKPPFYPWMPPTHHVSFKLSFK